MKSVLKRGSWLVTIPVAGLSAAYLLFVLLPTRSAVEQLERDVSMKRQFAAQAAAIAASAVETENEIAETERYIASRIRIAGSEGRGNVLAMMAKAAKAADLVTTRFEPDPPESYELFDRGRVAIGLQGTYDAVFDFIRQLEAMPATLWIESVAISANVQDEQNVQCEVTVEIFAFKSEKTNQVEFASSR